MPLPLPPHWPLRPRPGWGPVAGAVLAGTAFLVFGVVAVVAGDPPWLALGLAVFWYALALSLAPRGGTGVESRDGAVAFTKARWRMVAFYGGTSAFGLGLAAELGWPWGLLAVAGYAAPLAVFASRGGFGGEVVLDPEGVTFATRRYTRRVPWSEAGDVRVGRRQRLLLTAVGEGVWVKPQSFAADPLAFYWTLHYYTSHPESRDELGDGRAVERIEREALV